MNIPKIAWYIIGVPLIVLAIGYGRNPESVKSLFITEPAFQSTQTVCFLEMNSEEADFAGNVECNFRVDYTWTTTAYTFNIFDGDELFQVYTFHTTKDGRVSRVELNSESPPKDEDSGQCHYTNGEVRCYIASTEARLAITVND